MPCFAAARCSLSLGRRATRAASSNRLPPSLPSIIRWTTLRTLRGAGPRVTGGTSCPSVSSILSGPVHASQPIWSVMERRGSRVHRRQQQQRFHHRLELVSSVKALLHTPDGRGVTTVATDGAVAGAAFAVGIPPSSRACGGSDPLVPWPFSILWCPDFHHQGRSAYLLGLDVGLLNVSGILCRV